MLSDTQLETYRRDGVLFPIRVLDDAELTRFRAGLERLEERLEGDAKRVAVPHLFFRWARELATHPRVLDAVEAVLGPELVINATLILTKPPEDPSFISWHQDGTHSGLHRTPNVSVWLALRDSTPESGCMRVVPGSHRREILPHVASRDARHMLRHSPEIAVEVDESEAVDVALRAGEMSLHHSNIIHGSNANRSPRPRTGFIVRFVTPAGASDDHPIVHPRGRADVGRLAALAPPPADDFEQAFARWRVYDLRVAATKTAGRAAEPAALAER